MSLTTAPSRFPACVFVAGIVTYHRTQLYQPSLDHISNLLGRSTSGGYVQARDDILGKIETGRSTLEMWVDRYSWSQRMALRGFVTRSQAEADRASKDSADLTLKKIQSDLEILEKFDKRLKVTDLLSKLEEANRALQRVREQARAKLDQFRADWEAKAQIYEQEKTKADEIQQEIDKCHKDAPQDGLVAYFVPEQSRFGSGSQQSIVAQGEPVREGQKLMRIPNLRKMLVNTKVHEALVSRVKGAITEPTGWSDAVRAALMTSPHGGSRMGRRYAFAEM